ncbi:MAG: hypothetical protein ABI347_11530 [Nitrososphaera sp.]|jgi:hypothetical protein
MSFNFWSSSSLLIFLIIIATASLIPISNISAAAQTSNSRDLEDECSRLGISPENCSEEEVLKNRASHPPGTGIVDNKTKIMNWWIVIAIIAAILGGAASVFLLRSNILKRETH